MSFPTLFTVVNSVVFKHYTDNVFILVVLQMFLWVNKFAYHCHKYLNKLLCPYHKAFCWIEI